MTYQIDPEGFVGPGGSLPLRDDISRKLAMLIEGECGALGATKAATKFGFSRQRYYQLRKAYREKGVDGLTNRSRGPKTNYRRTDEVVRQAIRYRLLDPDVSSEVIAQKLVQCGFKICKRSVDRIFEEYGLQKKTLQVSPESETGED